MTATAIESVDARPPVIFVVLAIACDPVVERGPDDGLDILDEIASAKPPMPRTPPRGLPSRRWWMRYNPPCRCVVTAVGVAAEIGAEEIIAAAAAHVIVALIADDVSRCCCR